MPSRVDGAPCHPSLVCVCLRLAGCGSGAEHLRAHVKTKVHGAGGQFKGSLERSGLSKIPLS